MEEIKIIKATQASTEQRRKNISKNTKSWEKEYPDHKLWDNHKWAWEFLRRNLSFIRACDKVAGKNKKQQEIEIARTFGLREFKRYDDESEPEARFSNINIETWHSEKQETLDKNLKIKPGQMLILFNVDLAISTEYGINSQIREATQALEEYKKNLLEKISNKELHIATSSRKKRKIQETNLVRHLKIIDERRKEKQSTWAQIARMVFREEIKGKGLTDSELTVKYRNMMAASLQKPMDYLNIFINTQVSEKAKIASHKKQQKAFAEMRKRAERIKAIKERLRKVKTSETIENPSSQGNK